MNKFILIGIPNCGKSTLGKRAADILNLPFYDTDILVCENAALKDPRFIFGLGFSGRFLPEQNKVIAELAELDGPAIIATWISLTHITQITQMCHIPRDNCPHVFKLFN